MTRVKNPDRPLLLRKIDRILGSSYSLRAVIRKIYHVIARVFDTSNFYIALYEPRDNTISFQVYKAEGRETVQPRRPLSHGLTEYVITSQHCLRIGADIDGVCRRLGIKPFVHGRNAKSWLGVPMIYKGKVEGVINIQDLDREHAYSEADEIFLSSIAARAAVVVANTRLIEAEIKRARELALMNQIAHRLTRRLAVDDICRTVARAIVQYFRNVHIAVLLIENGELKLREMFADCRPRLRGRKPVEFGQGIVGRTARLKKTIVANDVSRCPFYRAIVPLTKSEIAVPMTIARRVIGVLDIQSARRDAFPPASARVLELIADRLSVALHNARLYEQATDHARELAVSFSIAKSLSSSLKLDDVLHRILEVIRATFGYYNVAILLLDRPKRELYIKAAHGYSERLMKKVRFRLAPAQGITGHVAATGRPYYAPDVSADPHYKKWKSSIRSEAAVPLKIKGELLGVLDIESTRPNAFTERDLRLFSVFASQAAVAIENARLYDETRALSLTDGLTGIPNRRHFDLIIDNELKKARSYSRPVSLAMIDLDDFKRFNDRYGHPAGDRLLTHVAQIIVSRIRATDFAARYGGEEFVVIFPETNISAALKVAERIWRAIGAAPRRAKGLGKASITVSVGLATCPVNGQTAAELLRSADLALYRAKRRGKNRIETA